MAKIANVYKDKTTGKFFYKKRLPKGNPTGKEWAIKKGFDTATKARKALDTYLSELATLEIKKGTATEKGVTIETFTCNVAYGYWQHKLKQSVMVGKKNHCRYIFNYFDGKTFNDISKKDIAQFKNHLINYDSKQGGKLKAMTINLILCTLAQIYDLACEHELVEKNIAREIKGLPQKTKTEIDYWTLSEFENFLSVIDDSTYKGYLKKLGFYTLFFSGMRVGEMMARKWTDIDWDNNAIYIDSTLRFENVNNWSASVKDGPKTVSSKAWVKLTPKTMEMLRTWKAMQAKVGKMEYIFMLDGTMYNSMYWTNWKNAFVKKWNKQAPEDQQLKNIRVHDLRDSHGMFLLIKGADLKTIQKKLRHAKATTTMNYYLDKLPEVEDKILQGF